MGGRAALDCWGPWGKKRERERARLPNPTQPCGVAVRTGPPCGVAASLLRTIFQTSPIAMPMQILPVLPDICSHNFKRGLLSLIYLSAHIRTSWRLGWNFDTWAEDGN
jgi:hypothetical protein